MIQDPPQDRLMGHLGPSWGPSGAILGHLGAILGHLGPSWGRSLAILAHLVAHFGRSSALLGRSGAILGFILADLGPSWGLLGSSWAVLGRILGRLRPSWTSSWAIVFSELQKLKCGRYLRAANLNPAARQCTRAVTNPAHETSLNCQSLNPSKPFPATPPGRRPLRAHQGFLGLKNVRFLHIFVFGAVFIRS